MAVTIPRITLRHVANAARCHYSTVSLALRNDPQLPQATRDPDSAGPQCQRVDYSAPAQLWDNPGTGLVAFFGSHDRIYVGEAESAPRRCPPVSIDAMGASATDRSRLSAHRPRDAARAR